MEIAQLSSALLGQLPEATALEPVKLPLILSRVCSLSSANYFPNPFGIFFMDSTFKKEKPTSTATIDPSLNRSKRKVAVYSD